MRQERKNTSNVQKPVAAPEHTQVSSERPWKGSNGASSLTMDSRSPSDSARWMDELQEPERWDGMS